jgi:hypothetical protein
MWEIVRVVLLGGVFAGVGGLMLLTKDRSDESDDAIVSRLATYLSETLRRQAPSNPMGQVVYCRNLLRDRIEDGADRAHYARILVEALHRNWPHLPREYFAAAFQ